jgi:hypothetical protein
MQIHMHLSVSHWFVARGISVTRIPCGKSIAVGQVCFAKNWLFVQAEMLRHAQVS